MEIRITNRPELGPLMTFEHSKDKPVHGWFWYKEGYAPEIVDYAIKRYSEGPKTRAGSDKPETRKDRPETRNERPETRGAKPETILDPFCGVGTTLLAAKTARIASIGVDASPLAAFVSKVKTQDYEGADLARAMEFLAKRCEPAPKDAKWEFELFDARAAFPKRNYNEILSIRHAIEGEEGKTRDLLLLALLSVLPQSSIILKDGGVLKIQKEKRALPAMDIFRRKVKRMVRELESSRTYGHVPQVFLGDARALGMADECVDLVMTSPPYLNNIDYSKIYGLELSLLEMSKSMAGQMRMRAVRSFIGKQMEVADMPPEVGDIGYMIPIIGTYFKDMEAAMMEMRRVLRPGGSAHIIVSNSVIRETHVIVDEIFAEMALRIGFSDAEIVVGAERTADVKPHKVKTRESDVILTK